MDKKISVTYRWLFYFSPYVCAFNFYCTAVKSNPINTRIGLQLKQQIICVTVGMGVFLPLIIGVLVYGFGRNCFMSHEITSLQVRFPKWITYNLPDGLWLFAFLNCLWLIWNNDYKSMHAWTFTVTIFSIGSEYLQKAGIIAGTFDLLDIFFYLLAYFLFLLCSLPFQQSNKTITIWSTTNMWHPFWSYAFFQQCSMHLKLHNGLLPCRCL